MKVLKHGQNIPRKFVCINCGCEFVADITEYWRSEYCGVVYYRCDCPECTYTSEKSEPYNVDGGTKCN